MSALAGWIKSKEGIPVGRVCDAFVAAEAFNDRLGKQNIRDEKGKSRLALACYGLTGGVIRENNTLRVLKSLIPGWTWVRGWLSSEMSVDDWFYRSGLVNTSAVAVMGEITAHNNYHDFTAPVEITDNLIGATVGNITGCVDNTPEISEFAKNNRQSPKDGDGIMLVRYLSEMSRLGSILDVLKRMSSTANSLYCAFIEPANPITLYLVRSYCATKDVNPNRAPYLHFANDESTLYFSTLACQIAVMASTAKPIEVPEASVVSFS